MKALTLIFFLSISGISFAQSDSNILHQRKHRPILALQGRYQNGYVFGTNDFLKGKNSEVDKINSYQAFSLKLSFQTTGTQLWQQLYKYPHIGIGLYVANFDSPKEVGLPIAFYGFFNAPFKRWDKLSLNYELDLGVAFNWQSFNPVSNPFNTAIGAEASFFVDVGMMLQYSFYNHLELQTGLHLNHFSNGALKKPNKGINAIAPEISMRYKFFDPPEWVNREIPIFEDKNEWLISFFSGIKNVIFHSVDVEIKEKYEGVNFPIYGISTAFNRQISRKSKIGIGFSATYNSSANAQAAIDDNKLDAVDQPLFEKLQFSIYPSYELLIDRLSIILQPAFYIYRAKAKNQSHIFYQRVGVKYHFTNRLFGGLTLRGYDFFKSDFIEWNIGYRIKWK